jgi:hypothetical protein
MKAAAVFAALLAASPLVVAQVNPADPLGVEPPGTPPEVVALWEEFYNQMTNDVRVVNGYCVVIPMTRRQWLVLHRASI